MMQDETDYKRLGLAVFLAAVTLIGWQALVEWPRRQQLAQFAVQKAEKQQAKIAEDAKSRPVAPVEDAAPKTLEERLAASPRAAIVSEKLHGSLNLKGARLDYLRLAKYRVELRPDSPEVTLLSPGGETSYFAQVGWVAADAITRVPDGNSQWQVESGAKLTPDTPLKLSWDNGEGVIFRLTFSLDRDYMFSIAQAAENKSGRPIALAPYAYVNRAHAESGQPHYGILHEGPLGVMSNALEEIGYEELREKGPQVFDSAAGWLGFTDKYWLAALIPAEAGYKATFSHYASGGQERYQADYLGKAERIEPGDQARHSVRLFAGAKEIEALDRYAAGDARSGQPPIPLFDRAVDFGVLYFLTKPMFLTLNFFYAHTGNFGIAILLLTVIIKLLMYPLANKSYASMAQMRKLQPEMLKLRERYGADQIGMQKEMMALYKREKVNPASGCLPILIQMPVFFALYKVLFVTIEMRHAPFFGWLKDLSAADPSNVFTLFGLVEWGPPAFLHLGLLPILFCASMVIQMKQQPKPADPIQAKVIMWMPYLFLFLFATMPAGLVLYWVWSNVLSILQQQMITRRYQAKS